MARPAPTRATSTASTTRGCTASAASSSTPRTSSPTGVSRARDPAAAGEPSRTGSSGCPATATRLLDAIASGRCGSSPPARRNEVLAFVEAGLRDFSFSRSAARARGWGMPVPGDPSQVDLRLVGRARQLRHRLGYGDRRRRLRRWWPDADAARARHRQGHRCASTRLLAGHAAVGRAAAADRRSSCTTTSPSTAQDLPSRAGDAVDPVKLASATAPTRCAGGCCAGAPVGDTDFTVRPAADAADQDLAGGVGNLVNRVVTMVHRLPRRRRARWSPIRSARFAAEVLGGMRNLRGCGPVPDRSTRRWQAFDFRAATRRRVAVIAQANRFVEDAAP